MDYCECGGKCPGYLSLRDEFNTFICGRCLKPSYLVWLGSERFCEECCCSIYTRWELVCSSCQTVIIAARDKGDAWALAFNLGSRAVESGDSGGWIGWPEAAEKSKDTWPYYWSAT